MDNLISWIMSAVIYGTTLTLSGLGETLNEKSGHLNLGVPGIMYLAAICSFLPVYIYEQNVANPLAIVSILIAIVVALAVGAIMGFIYSLLCVTFKANQNVVGLVISTFGVGFGKFISSASHIVGSGGVKASFATTIFNTGIPVLKDIPYVGQIFFGYGFMTYLVLILAILANIFLRKTRIGLNLKSVGENPATADAVGINVTKFRYIATMTGCGLCGLGGITYVLTFASGLWSTNNGIEAIGWLAVALVIFSSWRPKNLIWGSVLFGLFFWTYNYLPSLVSIPSFTGLTEILEMLPYIFTIIVLIINSLRRKKENQPPESLGLPYFREER
jgi:ABC-type uncharacterized transport system permease subunit